MKEERDTTDVKQIVAAGSRWVVPASHPAGPRGFRKVSCDTPSGSDAPELTASAGVRAKLYVWQFRSAGRDV